MTIAAPSKETILIVDDEKTIRRSLSRCLSKSGFDCEEASNASEAFDMMSNKSVELVILDIMMPGTSGSELLPQIKNAFPYSRVG